MKLVLASGSPRRKLILEREGFLFSIEKSDFNESNENSPEQTTVNNALGKAKDVFFRLKDENAVVLGADTVVVLDGKIIGKPKTKLEAISTLKKLSNRSHIVVTGYAVVCKTKTITGYDVAKVNMDFLSNELIEEYVKTGKPMDKAGSYGLQDGFIKVKSIDGDYDTVIGLPIKKIKPVLDKLLTK